MTIPVYISLTDLAEQWHVSRDYLREMRRRDHDALPVALLPGKKNNPVGLVSEIEAWRLRNSPEDMERRGE